MSKKVYIAGPDVFEHNAIELGKKYCALCKQRGFVGLFPLDNDLSLHLNKSPQEIAQAIFSANIMMINQADLLIANLNPFRSSVEPDSGTVFEVGYAIAQGKKVIGYMHDTRTYLERYKAKEKVTQEGDVWLDENQKMVEDFSLPLNLMLGCSLDVVQGGFEEALEVLTHSMSEG